MISSRSISTFLVSWRGSVLVAALFLLWRYRKRLWKARRSLKFSWKWVKWVIIGLLAVIGVETHIAVSRLLLMTFLLCYCWFWNRRYRKAKGKQREVYH